MTDTLARMRQLVGPTADWAANDLVIGDGELALERWTGGYRVRIGDGVKRYSELLDFGDEIVGVRQPFTGSVPWTMHGKNQLEIDSFAFMTEAQRADVLAGTLQLDVTAAIQAAVDWAGSIGGGRVKLCGKNRISAAINVRSVNVSIDGDNKLATQVVQYALGARVFNVSAAQSSISRLGVDYAGTPTSNACAFYYENASFADLRDVSVQKCSIGIECTNCVAVLMTGISVRNYELVALYAHDLALDIHIEQFIFDALDAVKGRLGGIRLFNQVEAFTAHSGDIINGVYSMTTGATANVLRQRPSANELTNVYFDSALSGALLDFCFDTDFLGCWWSYTGGTAPNLTLGTTDSLRFIGGRSVSSHGHGVMVGSAAKNTSFLNFTCRDNSLGSAGTYHGLFVDANNDGLMVIGGKYGGPPLYSASGAGHGSGINLFPGCTNYTIRGANVVGNITNGIQDNVNLSPAVGTISGCPGYVTHTQGTDTVAVGAASKVVTHGLATTPLSAAQIALTLTSSAAASGVSSVWVSAIGATTFTVNTNANVTGVALSFGWKARIKGD